VTCERRSVLSQGHLSDYELQEAPKENVLVMRQKVTLSICEVAEQVNGVFG
jgi:hypothetical protein